MVLERNIDKLRPFQQSSGKEVLDAEK